MVWRSLRHLARALRARRRRPATARAATAAAAGRRRRRRGGRCERGQHVALGDAAVLAGAGDGRRDRCPLSAAMLAHGGRERRCRAGGRLGRRGRGGAGSAPAAGGRGLGRRGSRRPAAAARRRRSSRAGRRRRPSRRPCDDLAEHAGGRRGDFEGDLVGLELDQGLVRLHRVARLLEPLADGRFGDRFAERRDLDFGCHGLALVRSGYPACDAQAGDRTAAPNAGRRANAGGAYRRVTNASSRKASSCARCLTSGRWRSRPRRAAGIARRRLRLDPAWSSTHSRWARRRSRRPCSSALPGTRHSAS